MSCIRDYAGDYGLVLPSEKGVISPKIFPILDLRSKLPGGMLSFSADGYPSMSFDLAAPTNPFQRVMQAYQNYRGEYLLDIYPQAVNLLTSLEAQNAELKTFTPQNLQQSRDKGRRIDCITDQIAKVYEALDTTCETHQAYKDSLPVYSKVLFAVASFFHSCFNSCPAVSMLKALIKPERVKAASPYDTITSDTTVVLDNQPHDLKINSSITDRVFVSTHVKSPIIASTIDFQRAWGHNNSYFECRQNKILEETGSRIFLPKHQKRLIVNVTNTSGLKNYNTSVRAAVQLVIEVFKAQEEKVLCLGGLCAVRLYSCGFRSSYGNEKNFEAYLKKVKDIWTDKNTPDFGVSQRSLYKDDNGYICVFNEKKELVRPKVRIYASQTEPMYWEDIIATNPILKNPQALKLPKAYLYDLTPYQTGEL